MTVDVKLMFLVLMRSMMLTMVDVAVVPPTCVRRETQKAKYSLIAEYILCGRSVNMMIQGIVT